MKKFFLKYRGEILLSLITSVSIIFTLALNFGMSKIRLAEIRYLLTQSETLTRDVDYSGLIVQYRFRMALYSGKLTQAEADLIELRAASMFPVITSPEEGLYDGMFFRLIAGAVNAVKAVSGKPAFALKELTPANSLLESAYFFEKNSLYAKALEKYEEAQRHELSSVRRGGIMLHQGFCMSLEGDISGAVKKYAEVITMFPDDTVSVTASLLLQLLKDFSSETERVKMMPDSSEKIEKLFRLIAFNDSLKVIETMEQRDSYSGSLNLEFYKARCLESTGRISEAISLYQKIIEKNPGTEYARSSNRRILLIGFRSGLEDESTAVVRKNNRIVRDDSIHQLIGEAYKLRTVSGSKFPFRDNSGKDLKPVLEESEKEFNIVPVSKNRKIKITTHNGDVIIGSITDEDETGITVRTGAGEAYIMKASIKKTETR